MGPKFSSTSQQADYKALLQNFDIVGQLQSQGLHYLRQKRTGQYFLLRQFTFNDKKQYQKYFEILQKRDRQLLGCKYLIPLEKLLSKSQDQYCSTFYKIFALFKWSQRTLEDQMLERIVQKRKFQQKQLWSILASCILGMSHLQKQGIKHQTLSSKGILIAQDGNLSVYDPIAIGNQNNFDILITKRSTPHIYLSPEAAYSLQKQQGQPNCNPYKSDIWTLAMIMLETGLNQYQDDCYREQGSRIHWQTLQFNLHRFRQSYSQDLSLFVEYMLSRQQKNRPDWIQLQQRVIKDQQSRITSQHQSFARNNPYKASTVRNFEKPTQSIVKVSELSRPTESIIKLNDGPRHPDFIPTRRVQTDKFVSQPVGSYKKIQTNQPLNASVKKQPINLQTSNVVLAQPVQVHSILTKPTIYPSNRPQVIRQPLIQSQSTIQHDSHGGFSRPNNIQSTRPLRNLFPNPFYATQTQTDQNLIILSQQERYEQLEDTPSNRFHSSYFETHPPSDQHLYSAPVQYHTPNSFQQNVDNQRQSHQNSVPDNKIVSVFQPQIKQNQGQYVIQKYKQGSQYKGYKWQGMRHGHGIFYYQDGGMYQGEWRHNKMQGKGKLYYQSGKLAYEGNWINDQFSGLGILYNESPEVVNQPIDYKNLDDIDDMWIKYEGQFKQDLKQGKGILYFTNGQYVEGIFYQDFLDGQAVFHRIGGQNIRGRWSKNILVE